MNDTEKKIRWGIMGVAKINQRLIPGFKGAKKASLQAIASRSLEKAREAAKVDEIPQAYGSYEELLADKNIDAIYIPLPNHMHYEWACKCADVGKHVLCEKPLTPIAKESESLVDYFEKKKIKLMDGFFWPHHPRTHLMKKIIQEGKIGQVQQVHGAFTFPLQPLSTENIRLQADSAGGGLLDVGCYPVYGIRWAMQEEPLSVFAKSTLFAGVDVNLCAQLTFANNRYATFSCGFISPFRAGLEIVGTEGVLKVDNMWVPKEPTSYWLGDGENGFTEHRLEPVNQISCMIDDISEAILNNSEVIPHPREAIKTLKVLDAIKASTIEGREVLVQK